MPLLVATIQCYRYQLNKIYLPNKRGKIPNSSNQPVPAAILSLFQIKCMVTLTSLPNGSIVELSHLNFRRNNYTITVTY